MPVICRHLHLLRRLDKLMFIFDIFKRRLLKLLDCNIIYVIKLCTHIDDWSAFVPYGIKFLLGSITVLLLFKLANGVVAKVVLESWRHLLVILVSNSA
jgi:hypothetical protein